VNAGDAPQFVTLGEVLTAHRMAIMRFGGTEGVRDMGLLESAMAQPKAMFGDRYLHASIAEMGAAYAFHIAKNHPFVDGNKRTAWATMRNFLLHQGLSVEASDEDAVSAMIAVCEGTMDKRALAKWISDRLATRTK
jgi:death-on-curing protein